MDRKRRKGGESGERERGGKRVKSEKRAVSEPTNASSGAGVPAERSARLVLSVAYLRATERLARWRTVKSPSSEGSGIG